MDRYIKSAYNNGNKNKYTDDKINQLVFELYGLSEEEVEIVENV